MRHVAQAGAAPIIAMTSVVGFAALDTEASCSIVHALEVALEEAKEWSEAEPEPEPEPDASGIVGAAAITPVTQPK
jgi:hypothetical protein